MSGGEPSAEQRLALRALANGKAPPSLHDELFVGRSTELASFEHDLDLVEAGGASLRILVGDPGSGKTMLQEIMASRARERGFITSSADLTPDRLFHGRRGEGRALVGELVLAMQAPATQEVPAVDAILRRFAGNCRAEADETGRPFRTLMRAKLSDLHGRPKGADFAKVIETFATAPQGSSLATNCRSWLCGDFSTCSDARDQVGVSVFAEDQDFWLMQRHWAAFLRLAGRPGYIVFIDEAQVLCGLHNPNARMLNLEHLLVMFNDVLQGRVKGVAVVIAATPAFVTQWNGLAKHEGLSSCLLRSEPSAVGPGSNNTLLYVADLAEPELKELLDRCQQLRSACQPDTRLLPSEAIDYFLHDCGNGIGSAQWKTPRCVMQSWLALHDRLSANPQLEWFEILGAQDADADEADMAFDGYAHRQI